MATFNLNIIEAGFDVTPKATSISAGLCTNNINVSNPVYFLSTNPDKFAFITDINENNGLDKIIITNITYYKNGLITHDIQLVDDGTVIQNSIVSNIPYEISLNDIADETAIPNLTFEVVNGNGINGDSIYATIYFRVVDNEGAQTDIVHNSMMYTLENCGELPTVTPTVITNVGPACGQVNYQIVADNQPTSYSFTQSNAGWFPGFGSPDFRALYSLDYSTGLITGAYCGNVNGDVEIAICNDTGCIRQLFSVSIDVSGDLVVPVINSPLTLNLDLRTEGKSITYQMQARNNPTSFTYTVPSGVTYSIDANDPSIITLIAPGAGTFNITMEATNPAGTDTETLSFVVVGMTAFNLQTSNPSDTICSTYDNTGYVTKYHNGANSEPDATTTYIYEDVRGTLKFDGDGKYYNVSPEGSAVYVGDTIQVSSNGLVMNLAECNA